MGLLSGPASRSKRDPEPLACASKIKFFSPIPWRLNLTCQRPTRFPACDGEFTAEAPNEVSGSREAGHWINTVYIRR